MTAIRRSSHIASSDSGHTASLADKSSRTVPAPAVMPAGRFFMPINLNRNENDMTIIPEPRPIAGRRVIHNNGNGNCIGR